MAVEAEGLPRFGRCDAPPRFGLEEAESADGPDSPSHCAASDELMGLGGGGLRRLEPLEPREEDQGSPGSPLQSGSPAPEPAMLVLPPPLPSLEAPTHAHAPSRRPLEPVAEEGNGPGAAAAGPPAAPAEPAAAAAGRQDSLRQRLAETSGKVERVLLETREMHAHVQAQGERFEALSSEYVTAQERAEWGERVDQMGESIADLQAQHADHGRSLLAARTRRAARRRASTAGTASDVWARHMHQLEQQVSGLASQVEAVETATAATAGGASGSSASGSGIGEGERPQARSEEGSVQDFATREELRQLGEALSQLRGEVAQVAAGAVEAAARGTRAGREALVTQEQLQAAMEPLRAEFRQTLCEVQQPRGTTEAPSGEVATRAELVDLRKSLERDLAQLAGRGPAEVALGGAERELRGQVEGLKAQMQTFQGLADDIRQDHAITVDGLIARVAQLEPSVVAAQEHTRAVGELLSKVAHVELGAISTEEKPRAAVPSSRDSARMQELEEWSERAKVDIEHARRSLEGLWEDMGAIRTRQDLLVTTAGSEREALVALQSLVHDVRRESSQACDELRTQLAALGATAAESSQALERASEPDSGGEELTPAPREPIFQRCSLAQQPAPPGAEVLAADNPMDACVELAAAPCESATERQSLSSAPARPALVPSTEAAGAFDDVDGFTAAPQEPLAHRRSYSQKALAADNSKDACVELVAAPCESVIHRQSLSPALALPALVPSTEAAGAFDEDDGLAAAPQELLVQRHSQCASDVAKEDREGRSPRRAVHRAETRSGRRAVRLDSAASAEEDELLEAPPQEPWASRQSLWLPREAIEALPKVSKTFSGLNFDCDGVMEDDAEVFACLGMDCDGIIEDPPQAEVPLDLLEGLRGELREVRTEQEGLQREAESDREVVKQLVQHLQQEFTQALEDLRQQVSQLESSQEPEEEEDFKAPLVRADVDRLVGQLGERLRQELADASASIGRDVSSLAEKASRSENGLHTAQQNLEALRAELQTLEQRSAAPPEELRQELRLELRSLSARALAQEEVSARRDELASLRESFSQELERLSCASLRLERGLSEAAEARGEVERLWENFNHLKTRLDMLDHGACNEKEAVQVLKQHLTDVRRESALMADELRAQVLEICSRPPDSSFAEPDSVRGVASLRADLSSMDRDEVTSSQITWPMSEAVRQELDEAAGTLARQMAALAEHMKQSVAGLTQGLDALHGDVSSLRQRGDMLMEAGVASARGMEDLERRVACVEEVVAFKGKNGAMADLRVDLEMERLREELKVLRERGDRFVEVQAKASREVTERFKHFRAEVQETQVAFLLQDSKDCSQHLERLGSRVEAIASEVAGTRTDLDQLRDNGFTAKAAQAVTSQELSILRDDICKLPQLKNGTTCIPRPDLGTEAVVTRGPEDEEDEEVVAAEELFLEFFRRHSLPFSLRLSELEQQVSALAMLPGGRLAQGAELKERDEAEEEECRRLRRDLSTLEDSLSSLRSEHDRISKQFAGDQASALAQAAASREAEVPALSFARLTFRVERLELDLKRLLEELNSQEEELDDSAATESEREESHGPLIEF